MLRDITIGQFFPGETVIHNLDPRVKIMLVLIFIVLLFLLSSAVSLFFFMILVLIFYKVARIPFKLILKNLKPLLFIVVFTSLINMFFMEGEPLLSLGSFVISKEGVILSVLLILRIINMVMVSSLLTYTTSPIELTFALERLMKPLKIIKIPVSDIAMMMAISLRFIPMLIQETDKIMVAQKSRGARIDTGNMFQRVKSFIPIIIPLFVSAFRAADDLAVSMECRCYSSGEGRTSMRELKIRKNDFLASVFSLIFLIIMFLIDNKM